MHRAMEAWYHPLHGMNDPQPEGHMANYIRRRKFLAVLGGAVAWPLAARAQQSDRVRRIGVLLFYAENDPVGSHYIARLLEGLRQSGWTPGHNIQIDYRWGGADRDRFERYATELVELKPDLLVGQSTPAVAALQRATRTIPIVFVNVSDPIGSGFIESLPRPGRNVTGFSNFEPSMGGKWVELLKEIAPQVDRIALMSNPQTSPQARGYLPSIEAAARSLALQPIATPVHDAAEIERAIAALGRDAAGGLVMLSDAFTLVNRELIVKLANQHAARPRRRGDRIIGPMSALGTERTYRGKVAHVRFEGRSGRSLSDTESAFDPQRTSAP
jgi:ABC-type uncharacterized transport system substrate-binding protein